MTFLNNLFRKKIVDSNDLTTELKRCLSTLDLTILGLGHMIGGGIYVLTGQVASRIAGPGIVISFLLSGLAALLAALCYAELGARAPRAGSAYTFVFMSLGEFPAFIIGWQLIMEHLIGAAAVARTWSHYLDSFFDKEISGWADKHLPLTANTTDTEAVLSPHLDLPAFAVTMAVAGFVAVGVRSSATFNNTVTTLNLSVITVIIAYGLSFAKLGNWNDNFLPFGIAGVLSGASRCFFAYVGFDSIATAAEETRRPNKSLPLATLSAMGVVTTLYLLMSSTLTLMVPYKDIDPGAAFSSAFIYRGVQWASYLVAGGAVAGITTAVTGHLFTLPRCIYAMAEDGLLWRPLSYIHPGTKVPTFTILFAASVAAVMALFLNTTLLVDLLSIGTLWAYTLVACSLIKLRYMPNDKDDFLTGSVKESCVKLLPKKLLCVNQGYLVTIAILLLLVFGSLGSGCLVYGSFYRPEIQMMVTLSVIMLVISFLLICLHNQHKPSSEEIGFKVPLVPLLPFLSVLLNLLFIMSLPPITWTRLAVWLFVGLVIYFGYGYRNSSVRTGSSEDLILLQSGSPSDTSLNYQKLN